MTAKTNGHLQIILITVRRSHPPGDDHTHNTDKNRISQYSENYRVSIYRVYLKKLKILLEMIPHKGPVNLANFEVMCIAILL